MPESRSRKKSSPTPPPGPSQPVANPPWFVPVFVTLLILGLLWVVATYIFSTQYPIPGIGYWNLAIGFALMLTGFMMTMRWR